jgi:hypothetical protein
VGDVAGAVALFAVNEVVARIDRVAIGYLSVAVAISAILSDFESSHYAAFLLNATGAKPVGRTT